MATTTAKKAPAKRAPAKKTAPKGPGLQKADIDANDDDLNPASDLDLYRPAPDPRLLEQVPEDLAFTTDSGDRREPEKLLIEINGVACYLYQPPTSMLMLVASSLSAEAPIEDRVRTMLQLVSQCLDSQAERMVRAAMFSRDNSFDDAILGKLVATIINKWAPYTMDAADLDTSSRAPLTRQQRRAKQ